MEKQYIVAAVVLGLGLSGYAFAQVATVDLSACVTNSGEAHLIIPGFTKKESCNKGEQLVTWNIMGQQGPKGDQGDVGPQGPIGETGERGAIGPMGPQGPKGDTGDVGPQGIRGEQGLTGLTGAQGVQGDRGEKGDTGAPGTISTQIITGAPFVVTLSSEGNAFATAKCPDGTSVLGGGAKYEVTNGPQNYTGVYQGIYLTQSFPSASDTWQANAFFFNPNVRGANLVLTAYAICTR